MSELTTLTVANKRVSERACGVVLAGRGCVLRDGGDAV